MQNPQKSLKDIIPTATELNANDPSSPFYYTALIEGLGAAECTHFHLWVQLDSPAGSFGQKSNKSVATDPNGYGSAGMSQCQSTHYASMYTTNGGKLADSSDPELFDIFR